MTLGPKKTFLIIGSEVLVAQDVETTIRSLWPDAVVLFKANLQDAESWLESAENLLYTFVASPPEHVLQGAFQNKIAAQGGQLVMMGYDNAMKEALGAFAYASALMFLPFPFTEEHLLKLLRTK